MKRNGQQQTTVDSLTLDHRLELARRKADQLVDIWIELANIQATNRHIVYSREVAGQIPRSLGAHAFAYLQSSLMRYEIVRLCTLFDPCRDDDLHKVSIPAVLNLIRDPAIADRLAETTKMQWPSAWDNEFAERQADLTRMRWRFANRWGARAKSCSRLTRVLNLRHKHLAHTLEVTRMERARVVPNPKYGDERKLLLCARHIINALHLSVNATSFDWSGAARGAQRNAAALWNGTKFGATE